MSYNSRIYRILIASPSDIEEERELAVTVIQATWPFCSLSAGLSSLKPAPGRSAHRRWQTFVIQDERCLARRSHSPGTRCSGSESLVAQDPAGNLKPAKDKSTERIDGIVAAIMAIGRAMVAQEEPQPEYSMVFV